MTNTSTVTQPAITPLEAADVPAGRRDMVNFDVVAPAATIRAGLTPSGARAMAHWLLAAADLVDARAAQSGQAPADDAERNWAAARNAYDDDGCVYGVDPDRDRI